MAANETIYHYEDDAAPPNPAADKLSAIESNADQIVVKPDRIVLPHEVEPVAKVPEQTDIEIVVQDTRPEEDRRHPYPDLSKPMPPVESEDQREKPADKRIKELTWQANEARRREQAALAQLQAAEQYMRAREVEAQQLRQTVSQGEQWLQQTGKSKAESDAAAAEAAYKRAIEIGDADAQAKAIKALAEAAQARVAWEAYQAQFPQQQPQTFVDPRQAQPQFQPQPQPKPQYQPSQKMQEFLNKNPWYGKDERMTQAALAADRFATGFHGAAPESDEYWSILDKNMKEQFPEQYTPVTAQQPQRQQSQAPNNVAPVTRVNGNAGKQQVTLTQDEVAMCRQFGMDPKNYARTRALLKKEGANTSVAHDTEWGA